MHETVGSIVGVVGRRSLAAALALCCVAGAFAGPSAVPEMTDRGEPLRLPDDPARRFDFWLGDWDVRNLHLDDGSFHDTGSAKARIRSVVGGGAVLEQWNGTVKGKPLIGSSLRAWDPDAGRWSIWLNWHGGQPGGFFPMQGAPMTGAEAGAGGAIERMDQFPLGDDTKLRYGFSGFHEDSCQWDQANSEDGGETWTTVWVMQFSRTGPPRALDAANAPVAAPPAAAAEYPETRALDHLIGAWHGTAQVRGADGSTVETDARARVTSLIEGFALGQFVDTDDGQTSFAMLGWDRRTKGWLAIHAAAGRAGLAMLEGTIADDEAIFAGRRVRERWSCGDGDHCRFVQESSADGETWAVDLDARLERSASTAAWIDIPRAKAPFADVLSGGQPSPEQLRRIADEGYRTVINLRGPGEPEELVDEPQQVAALGMEYVSIPVASGDDLNVENARLLSEALARPGALPAVVHCRSGNRVGALFAIEAHELDGMDPERALEVGIASGLTALEPLVRERLGLDLPAPPEGHDAPDSPDSPPDSPPDSQEK